MNRLENTKLSKLPHEVKDMLVRGSFKIFTFDDPNQRDIAFILETNRQDRFLLNWEGDVVKHDSSVIPERNRYIVFPFPEMTKPTVLNIA